MSRQVPFAILALFLVAFPAVAQPAGSDLTLAARIVDGRLLVDVSAARSSTVQVVVSHEDPVSGAVVDRVVPLDLTAGTSASFSIDDLRLGTNFTVRLVEVPTVPTILDGLLDIQALLNHTSTVTTLLPSITPGVRADTPVVAYPYESVYRAYARGIWATRTGALVIAYQDHDGRLTLRTSLDGGHSFGDARNLTVPVGFSGGVQMRAKTAPDGTLVVILRESVNESGTWVQEPWHIARYDPISNRVLSDVVLGASANLRFHMAAWDFAPLADGSLLLATNGDVESGQQTRGPMDYTYPWGHPVQVWRIPLAGPATHIGNHTWDRAPERAIAVDASGAIAVVGAREEGSGYVGLDYAVSTDAGLTWSDARSVEMFDEPVSGFGEFPIRIDHEGTIHTALGGHLVGSNGISTHAQSFALRLPRVGDPVVTDIGATVPTTRADPYAWAHHLAQEGARVRVFWQQSDDLWTTESLDAGRTYAPPTRLRETRTEQRIGTTHNDGAPGVAIMPDGHPILMGTVFMDAVVVPLHDPLPFDMTGLVTGTDIALPSPLRILNDPALIELAPGERAVVGVLVHNPGRVPARDVGLRFGDLWANFTPTYERNATPLAPGETRLVRAHIHVPDDAEMSGGAYLLYTSPFARGYPRSDPWNLSIHSASPRVPSARVEVDGTRVEFMGEADDGLALEVDGKLRFAPLGQLNTSGLPRGVPIHLRAWPIAAADVLAFDTTIVIPPEPAPAPTQASPTPATPIAPPPAPEIPPAVDTTTHAAAATEGSVFAVPTSGDTEAAPSAGGSRDAAATATSDAGEPAPAPDRSTPFASPPVAVATGTTAAVAVVAVAAATETGRWALGLLAAALYTRLRKSDVLKNDVRAGIHAHIARHGGIRFTDLRRDVGIANGALVFHLRVLEREGYVFSRTEWTRKRYWVTGAAPPPAAADDATPSAVMGALRAGEPASAAEIAQRVGISRQLARYHLQRLAREGRVRAEGGEYSRTGATALM